MQFQTTNLVNIGVYFFQTHRSNLTYLVLLFGGKLNRETLGHGLAHSRGVGRSEIRFKPYHIVGWFSIGDLMAFEVDGTHLTLYLFLVSQSDDEVNPNFGLTRIFERKTKRTRIVAFQRLWKG